MPTWKATLSVQQPADTGLLELKATFTADGMTEARETAAQLAAAVNAGPFAEVAVTRICEKEDRVITR